MPEFWIVAAIGSAVAVAVGLHLLNARAKDSPLTFADEREERLTTKLARLLGCTLAQALPAVRRELELGANQPDDTILKRAAYHYRQDLPENSPCSVYRDRAPG